MGFRAMNISFKSVCLNSLLDSKRYNCLRCVYFATHFTLLSSKISSPVFSVSHKLRIFYGGARGVMVILAGNGFGDTSSNPGRD